MLKKVSFSSALFFMVLMSASVDSLKAEQVLYVTSQEQCDGISDQISWHLNQLPQANATETITVYFSGGVYKYNNGPFGFTNRNYPNVRIHFTAKPGETVHFIGDGNEYTPNEAVRETDTHYFVPLKSDYSRGEVYVDQDFNWVQVSNSGVLSEKKIHRAASRHETVRRVQEGKYSIDCIRFKLPEELAYIKNKDAAFFRNSLICFKIWFGHRYGTIDRTDDEYIYVNYNRSSMFEAVEDTPSWDSFKGYILFYITNLTGAGGQPEKGKVLVADDGLYIPKGVTKLYECKRQLAGWFYDNHFKEIKFSHLHFSGASDFDFEMYYNEQQRTGELLTYDGVSYYRATLMSFHNTDNVVFEDCMFRNIGSHSCVSTGMNPDYAATGGLTFRRNEVYDIGGKVVGSHLPNTVIDGNTFHNTGQFYSDRPDVVMITCKNYQVTNNRISDFSGNGMTIGYNTCTLNESYPVGGVVEGNELFFTSEFLNYPERYTLEDVHAIYFLNHQVQSVCRGNVVHDFEGYKFANGTGRCNNISIAVDCGGYNVFVTGNLVFNVGDMAFSAGYDENMGKASSRNLVVENNVFFAPYRLIGNPFEPTSCKANNNYAATDITGKNKDVLASLPKGQWDLEKGPDIIDEQALVENGKCYLNEDFSSLNLSPFVLQWLESFDVSNENVTSEKNRIWASGNILYIHTLSKQRGAIYTIEGRLVRKLNLQQGENAIPVTSGYYVVKLDGTTSQKVCVE